MGLQPHPPQVIAANVWRARAAHRRTLAAAVPSTSLSNRSRTFAHEWELNYEGFPADDRWLPKASASLTASIATAKRGRPHEGHPDDRGQQRLPKQHNRADDDRSASAPTLTEDAQTGRPSTTAAASTGSSSTPATPANTDHMTPNGADMDLPLPTMSRAFKRARLNDPPSQDAVPLAAATATSTSAATPHSNRCKRINHSGASSSGFNGGVGAAKRRKATSAGGDAEAVCAACKTGTSYSAGRFLPNTPWLPGPWRGARPGSLLCLPCYSDFTRSPSWPFPK
jgi:hypothetical protein